MPIKFKVNVDHFAQAAREGESPYGPGDIVFAWDDDSSCLVVGIHRDFKNTFDSDTGECTARQHRILVLSWTEPNEMVFDHSVHYPMNLRPMVVTPKGTGVIAEIARDKIIVEFSPGHSDIFNESEVKPFEWDKICNAEEKND